MVKGTMNLLSWLGLSPTPSMTGDVVSPFTETQLQTIVWSDIMGADFVAPLGRAEAMQIPAVSKARHLIVSTISRLPLTVLNAEGELPAEQQPSWTYRTDGIISPYLRMTQTVDDLLFYGSSLWAVVRGSEGQILSAEHVPFSWWSLDSKGAISVKGQLVNANEILYFPGMVEGLIDRGATALRSARNIDKAVDRRASSPIPLVEIHQLENNETLTQAEAEALVKSYNAARRDPEGASMFTPSHIELRTHGDKADSGALIEARNASRLDVANLTGVPVALLDGSPATASLTYSTQEGQRNQFVDFTLNAYMDPIQSRLSQDDVVARGQRVRFDLSDLNTTTPAPTGPPFED